MRSLILKTGKNGAIESIHPTKLKRTPRFLHKSLSWTSKLNVFVLHPGISVAMEANTRKGLGQPPVSIKDSLQTKCFALFAMWGSNHFPKWPLIFLQDPWWTFTRGFVSPNRRLKVKRKSNLVRATGTACLNKFATRPLIASF